VIDRFTPPWAPGGGVSGLYVVEGDPSIIGLPFSVNHACQPPALLYLSHPHSPPPIVSDPATRVVIPEPYPVQGVASPDGRTLRWFYGTIDGCIGHSVYPLVPDRVVMTRRGG